MAMAAPAPYTKMAFTFNGVKVYDAQFVKERIPTYFTGCSATILKIIEKKKIPISDYFFASYSAKNGYKECSAEYKSRKLLIKAVWVENNVPGFGKVEEAPIAKTTTKVYPPAPAILNLEEHEMFKDETGNIIDIEVRGERKADKIWFKASDVQTMLVLDDISVTLMTKGTTYERGLHYDTFDLIQCPNLTGASDQKKSGNQTALFLSYWGLVKMLFGRRHPIAVQFQRWAIDKLFVIQMGTDDQKVEVASDVMGVSTKALKAFLNTNITSMPVIYLFSLGRAKDLRELLSIPASFKDDDVVYKYGLTKDLNKRTEQHERTLGKMPGVQMTLKYHVYIDPLYLQEAENDIEKYFKMCWHLNHPKHTELVCISDNVINNIVHNEFKRLGMTYAGKLGDLQTQLANEQRINVELKKQIDAIEKHNQERIADIKHYSDMMIAEKETHLQRYAKLLDKFLAQN